MQRSLTPARQVRGAIRLPGDKSISHRYAMLSAIAEGASEIANYSSGEDCASTLTCLRDLGVPVHREDAAVRIEGAGLDGFRQPFGRLDAGNSGSTMRMLAGLLAGQKFASRIEGDESLSKRPMKRIIIPLEKMGARIAARDGEYPPLAIEGAPLRGIHYETPVPSAQVKTCVLFAGLLAEGTTSVREAVQTRDHSETALEAFGVRIERVGLLTRVTGRVAMKGRSLSVPCDISSASFFIAAALMLPGSELRIEGVGLNPTRTALLDLLLAMDASIEILPGTSSSGEPSGTLIVHGPDSAATPPITGGLVEKSVTAALIDEIPILAVLGAASRDGVEIRDARELRFKETDRIATTAENLDRMGVRVEAFEDGMRIEGRQRFHPGELDSHGDHRIAMAFAIAALCAPGDSVMQNAEAASVSFPEFYDTLDSVVA